MDIAHIDLPIHAATSNQTGFLKVGVRDLVLYARFQVIDCEHHDGHGRFD